MDRPRIFHYLNQSNCYEVDVIDDAKEYLTTRRAMDVVGIESHEQVVWTIGWSIVSFSVFYVLVLECCISLQAHLLT